MGWVGAGCDISIEEGGGWGFRVVPAKNSCNRRQIIR